MKQRVATILIAVICLPFIVLIGLIAAPFFFIFYLPYRFASRTHFRSCHLGQVYLMTTPSNGWAEFVDNNVLPVLPPGIIHLQDKHPDAENHQLIDLVRREIRLPPQRPYLVTSGRWRVRTTPLHEQWIEWKEQVRERDPQIQVKIRRSLADLLASSPARA